MNWLGTTALLAAAYLVVFLGAHVGIVRLLLGAQIDLLPTLMVYAALSGTLSTVTLLALAGGFWFDALSANPPGLTILPLFLVGVALHEQRALLLREEWPARSLGGLAACVAVPLLSVILLLLAGREPLVGWGSLWQLLVMGAAGAVVTPVWFLLFERLDRAFRHPMLVQTSFRPDRDIKRGR